ncbi:flavin reductase family protein [Nibrella viscosa]|uniref:Flavin reductase family protein n=1 Tax=Nibrella viscosa TaxID=1084524 RepID=A0ABP8KFM9_9BACT
MKTIDPKDMSQPEFHRLMIGSIGPRPIAFASTVDAAGRVNLSPFSFFNVFGSNPPTLAFAPNNNRYGQKKHTLLNVEEVPEVVVNVVNYEMVEQMSLASAEYERGVDEFVKAGFTPVPSERVRPPRVAESPVSYECTVQQIVTVGNGPGATNLIICQVQLAHFREDIFNDKEVIDQRRIDLVGRMGGEYYCRAYGEALFEVARPQKGIGFDQLPAAIRNSRILTGSDLGKLAAVDALPIREEIVNFRQADGIADLFEQARNGCQYLPDLLHVKAKELLKENRVREAWLVLLQDES